MNFEKGKMYILTFFYTGTDPMMAALNGPNDIYSEVWTDIPEYYLDVRFANDRDFDEGFVVIYKVKK